MTERDPQRPFRILVVEDNPHVAEIFRYAFKRIVHERLGTEMDVEVEEAEDGHQAWRKLEASAEERPFDLVILDLMLPVMDGRTVLSRVRATPALSHLPVLVVTAEDREACEEVKRLGANAVLRKPVQFTQIRDTIGRIL